jgi:hypothetical protein
MFENECVKKSYFNWQRGVKRMRNMVINFSQLLQG